MSDIGQQTEQKAVARSHAQSTLSHTSLLLKRSMDLLNKQSVLCGESENPEVLAHRSTVFHEIAKDVAEKSFEFARAAYDVARESAK